MDLSVAKDHLDLFISISNKPFVLIKKPPQKLIEYYITSA